MNELLGLPSQTREQVQEAVELMTLATDRRDVEFFRAISDPDVVLVTRAEWIEGTQRYSGVDGMATWWRKLDDVYLELHYLDARVVAHGDGVVVVTQRSTARLPQSVAIVESEVYLVGWWRDGLLCRLETYTAGVDALAAAGLGG